MKQTDEPLALPLWIAGHAYLTLAPEFLDVRNPASGEVLRRTPLCRAGEAQRAIAVAKEALGVWGACERTALLVALGDALASYAAHFVRLIVEESGQGEAPAAAEVAAVVALLRAPPKDDGAGVVVVIGNRQAPMLSALRLVIPALSAGATVIVRPAPETPSALYACAELTGRCAFPAGVFNVVHGAEAVVDGLRSGGARVLCA